MDERPPPPWYEEHWWVFLVVLLLIVAGIVAFFALRDRGDEPERAPATTTIQETQTTTATATTAETETETATTATEETAELPDLRGEEHDDAVEDLVDLGFLPETFPVESAEERATVVRQEPAPGTRLAAGSTVRLDVSLGAGEREELDVPDLVGLEPPQALEECARAGFTCRLDAGANPTRPLTSQRPAPGTAAPELTQIRLSQG